MRDNLNKIIIFALGAAVGSFTTYKILSAKYEDQDDCEDAEDDDDEEDEYEEIDEGEDDVVNYKNIIKENNYVNYSKREEEKKEEAPTDRPYVVSPDEFDTIDEYDTVCLTYYADDFLTYENNELVHDVEEIIGWENLNHFGDYEEDAVHIRNDELKTDYEILKVLDNYRDIKED